ncbi:MAG: hypothetical protein KJZ73_13055 [Pseudorhodoplanes sp.]|nr:hypothetical protein [Pseudorhodoplanes sp.]
MLMVTQLNGFGAYAADTAFAPTDIAGCAFWVRTDTVTKDGSNLVSSWTDLSGNNRHATEATNKPLWVDALVNGHPAIRFDGSNDKLVTPGFTVNAPFTCLAVFKNVAVTNDRRVVSFNTTVGASINQRTGPNIRLQGNGNDGPSVSTDTTSFHRYFCTWNGSSSVIAIDNGSDQTSGSDISQNLALVEIGTSSALGTYSNVEIAEMIVYDSVISGANRTNLATYLQTRYNLA